MNDKQINFNNKKILIYGFGKSGISCFNFFKKKQYMLIYDDNKKNIPAKFKKKLINLKKLSNISFDFIVLSPGIDIKKCKISNYLKKIGLKLSQSLIYLKLVIQK